MQAMARLVTVARHTCFAAIACSLVYLAGEGVTGGSFGLVTYIAVAAGSSRWQEHCSGSCTSTGILVSLGLVSMALGCEPLPGSGTGLVDGLHLVETEDLGREWVCEEAQGEGRAACYQSYIDLAMESVPAETDLEVCRDEHTTYIQDILEGTVLFKPLEWPTAEDLAEQIDEALGLGVWASEIDARPLEVVLIAEEVHSWGLRRILHFEDPLLGTNEVWELRPDADGPVPMLLALPGHPDGSHAALEMVSSIELSDYVEAGYGLLVLDTQAYDTGDAEHLASATLLCGGRPMMAARAYEVLLLHKYARYLQLVGRAEAGIGILGHSGGSVTANMLTRFFYDVDAVATDLKSNYATLGQCPAAGSSGVCLLDETFAPLHRLSKWINDPLDPPFEVPTYVTSYGYPEGTAAVIEFFDEHLLD